MKPRVLLVEDEDLVAMLTEDMLADLGCEVVVSAADLEAGLRSANDAEFEVAVLDVNLHGKQSFPIADVLHARSIPFVFVTGYGIKGVDPRFSGAPVLQKPFTADGLSTVLKGIGIDTST